MSNTISESCYRLTGCVNARHIDLQRSFPSDHMAKGWMNEVGLAGQGQPWAVLLTKKVAPENWILVAKLFADW